MIIKFIVYYKLDGSMNILFLMINVYIVLFMNWKKNGICFCLEFYIFKCNIILLMLFY